MPLSHHEVTEPTEFDQLVRCERLSYAAPLNTFFKVFDPDNSPAGFADLRDRTVTSWQKDPTSRWFKIVDSDLDEGLVIGAANWNVFTENPYPGKQRAEAGWWPEGMVFLFIHFIYLFIYLAVGGEEEPLGGWMGKEGGSFGFVCDDGIEERKEFADEDVMMAFV